MGRSLLVKSNYSDANMPPANAGLMEASDPGFNLKDRGIYSSSSSGTPIFIYDARISDIQKELQEIKELLMNIVTAIREASGNDQVIQIRKLSFSNAKKEIAKYFKENDGKDIGYDDLIEALRIDPRVVVKACGELEEEGKIG